ATAPKETIRLAILPVVSSPQDAPVAQSLLQDAAVQIAGLRSSPQTKLTVIPLIKTLRGHVDSSEKARSQLSATHILQATLTKENEDTRLRVVLADAQTNMNA